MYSIVNDNIKLMMNSKGEFMSSDGYIITDDEKKETLVVYTSNTLPQKLIQKYINTSRFNNDCYYTRDLTRDFRYDYSLGGLVEKEPEKAYKLVLRMIRKDKTIELNGCRFFNDLSSLIVNGNGLYARHYQYFERYTMVYSRNNDISKIQQVLNGKDVDSGLWWVSTTKKEDYIFDGINIYNTTDEEFKNIFGITKEDFKDCIALFKCGDKYYAITNENKIEKFNELLLTKFGKNDRGQCLELVEVK